LAVPGEETILGVECSFWDFGCLDDPWEYAPAPDAPGEPDDEEERGPEDDTTCPTESTTTTSAPTPTPSPLEVGDPSRNERDCYDSGRSTDHARLDNASKSFCESIGGPGDVLKRGFNERKFEPSVAVGSLRVEIVVSLDIFTGCQWTWSLDECTRYLRVPIDSCNCDGVNGKQGGIVENNCYRWRIDPNTKF
jgi:hypothetical protein